MYAACPIEAYARKVERARDLEIVFHESAHVVAAYAVGFSPIAVEVPRDRREGSARYRVGDLADAAGELFVLFAGEVVGKTKLGWEGLSELHDPGSLAHDQRRADDLIREHGLAVEAVRQVCAEVDGWLQYDSVWSAIEDIALPLVQRRRLDEAELADILGGRRIGWARPGDLPRAEGAAAATGLVVASAGVKDARRQLALVMLPADQRAVARTIWGC